MPTPHLGPEVKDDETIAAMRVAGGSPRRRCRRWAAIEPGVTTDRLDAIGHEFPVRPRAYPSTLGYRLPKSLCTSLNEVICHGIPDSTVVQDGDIVNIDITAYIGGVHGDTNATFLAGDVDEESRLLVERTEQATLRAIRACCTGPHPNVGGDRVVRQTVRLRVVRDFTGHGSAHRSTRAHRPHYDGIRRPHWSSKQA